jgi:hypothetical protein
MDGADAVPQSAPQSESHEATQPAAATAAPAEPERYFPPDFTVPLFFDAALPASDQLAVAARVARQLAQWQAQDEAGSADGAWAVSVLLGQQGQLQESAAAQHRADERGSADAPYRLACDLLATDPKAAEEALLRADARGSAGAADMLADLAAGRGQLAQERSYRERAIERATAADAAGSADAACLLGWIYARANAPRGAEAAYARADERGSWHGAAELARLLANRGELELAERAAERATRRGAAEGAYLLGQLLAMRGERRRAKSMYANAYVWARRQGKFEVVAASRKALTPPWHVWARQHIGFCIVTSVVLVVVGLAAGWRWAGAALVLLLTLIPLRWGIDAGVKRRVEKDDLDALSSVSAGNLTIFGGVDSPPARGKRRQAEERVTTRREVRVFAFFRWLLIAMLLTVAAWLARYIGTGTLRRALLCAIGLGGLIGAFFVFPQAIARPEPPPEDLPADAGVRFGFKVSVANLWNYHADVTIADPRLFELIAWVRAHLLSEPPLIQRLRIEARRAVNVASWLGALLLTLFFLLSGVAPGAPRMIYAIIGDTGSVIAALAVAVLIAVAGLHLLVAAVGRAPMLVLAALGPLLGSVLVVALAAAFGLLGDWTTAWHDLRI